jgi:hypothetical protein
MKITPIATVIQNWVNGAAAATAKYIEGIRNPRTLWRSATLAAVATWEAGIQQAISNNLFHKGVSNTTDIDWGSAAETKGAPRYAPGVRAGVTKYQEAFEPYHKALSSLQLPPRGPRNSESNYERVRLIGDTLAKIRIAGA